MDSRPPSTPSTGARAVEPQGAPALRAAQVWIVEDSPLEAERSRQLLAPLYEVEVLGDGSSLLERLAEGTPPALVLMDWKMPGVTGLDACRFLRQRFDEVTLPVLILTVSAQHKDTEEALAAGANDYVQKPCRPAELLARVRTLVRVQQQAESLQLRDAERTRALDKARAMSARLSESEERLRRVVEASGTGTWELDVASGNFTADARLRALMLLSEAAAFTLPSVLAVIHHEDRERIADAIAASLAGAEEGRYLVEFRIGDARPQRWLESRGQASFDSVGKPLRLTGTSVDITQRKQAEEAIRQSEAEFRALAEASPDTVFTTTPDGALTYVSSALLRYTGLSFAELVGEVRQGLIHPDERARAVESFAEALRRGEPYTTEFRVRGAGGAYRWQLVRALPVRDAEGRLMKWVGTAVDVHALRQVQADLQQRAEFEQQLIGIVSHDLRNPVAAIIMAAATLLGRSGLEEAHRRPLLRIQSSAERAGRMLRDLLDFTQARLGTGLLVQRSPGDLHEVVRQAVEESQSATPGRTIAFEQEGSGRGLWDADRLTQVVGNLLANALHYSPPDTAVRVTTRTEEGAVVLTVHNKGEPLAPDVLPRLFKPLQRGVDGASRIRSVGLGLYIVDQVVRAHGGSVAVESRADTGTTFSVRLPVAEV